MDKGKLCLLKDLNIGCVDPDEITKENRERYAKTALMLFSPFRELADLNTNGSYWATFDNLRSVHYSLKEDEPSRYISYNMTSFWTKGFDILENMEDKFAIEGSHQRAIDPLTESTSCRGGTTDAKDEESNKEEEIKDISFYCDGECDGDDTTLTIDEYSAEWQYSHARLIDQCNATEDRTLAARLSSQDSILFREDQQSDGAETLADACRHNSLQVDIDRSFQTIITLISGTLVGGGIYDEVYSDDPVSENNDSNAGASQYDAASANRTTAKNISTLQDFAREIARNEGTILDEKQYIMYEILVCTFLLGLLCNEDNGSGHNLEAFVDRSLSDETRTQTSQLIESLKQRGGREQLVMFVTGMAGAGKSTGIKVAQKYCLEFCRRASVMWRDNTFLFTAYTGSAAAAFGGLTTSSATFLNKPSITDEDAQSFWGVRIIIIDEISFMKDSELKTMDQNLKYVGDARKPFGGFSIVFGGDFQQLKPVKVDDKEILWHPSSSNHFENSLNCAIVLDGMHRFTKDKVYGDLLKRLCQNELTEDDIALLNTRVIGQNGLALPANTTVDTCYACPTNKERNSITASIFKRHVQATHPDAQSFELPPDHTIIIEADIQPTTGSNNSYSMQSLRRRIIELGDNDVRCGTKLVDPCLRCYTGGFFMSTSNEKLKEQGTGNGTQCRVVGIKLKQDPTSYKWKNWDGKKVWTVRASDVEFVQFEHYPKTREILSLERKLTRLKECNNTNVIDINDVQQQLQQKKSARQFKLAPQSRTCSVNVSPNDQVSTTRRMKCRVTQLPVISSDAITGHKLQGLTKDNLVVYSWNKSTNWIYVVLSRVRTLSGLFLVRRLKLADIKPTPRDYLCFLGRIRKLEQQEFRRCAMFKDL